MLHDFVANLFGETMHQISWNRPRFIEDITKKHFRPFFPDTLYYCYYYYYYDSDYSYYYYYYYYDYY